MILLLTHPLRDHTSELKKAVRFLSYVNQSSWEAKALLHLMKNAPDDDSIDIMLERLCKKFSETNRRKEVEGKEPLPTDTLLRLQAIKDTTPRWLSVINAADNWVIETHKDFARYPSDSEWERFLRSELNGVIGMSFALQWRYNFGALFRHNA